MDKFINMHPEALGDLEADLMCPPWTWRDVLVGVAAIAVIGFVTGLLTGALS